MSVYTQQIDKPFIRRCHKLTLFEQTEPIIFEYVSDGDFSGLYGYNDQSLPQLSFA